MVDDREAGKSGQARRATLRDWLEALVAGGAASAAVAAVADGRRLRATAAAGRRRIGRRAPPAVDDLFDAASLTKAFVATLALRLDAVGLLPLDARIGDLAPAARPELAHRRLEDLLRHRSGLAPWAPLEARLGAGAADPEARLDWLLRAAPLGAPRGTYSDLGYLLWAALAERATGEGLGRLLAERVLAPLGLGREEVALAPVRSARVVDSVLDNGREVELAAAQGVALAPTAAVLRGRPHDANARALGGVPGHAGLFVAAAALVALARAWLHPGGLLSRRAVAAALAGPRGPWALGWARRSRGGSSGLALSPAAFGLAGFAGGSLWIDPARDAILVLLAHRRSSAADFNRHRRAFHRLALERCF